MKKFLLLIVVFLCGIFSISACGDSDKDLKDYINELNSECPLKLGEWAIMEKGEYTNKTASVTISVSDGLLHWEAIQANDAIFRDNTLIGLSSSKEFQSLLKHIVDAKAKLQILFYDNGGRYSMIFDFKEIKENLQNGIDHEKYLNKSIENVKLQIPYKVAEGMKCVDVYLNDKYETIVIEVDESIYDMGYLELHAKNNLKNTLLNTEDFFTLQRLNLLVRVNRGIEYKYIGTSTGEIFSVFIEKEFLEKIATQNISPLEQLELIATEERQQLPQFIEKGVLLVDVFIDAKTYTYVYQVDESIYNIALFRNNITKSFFKQSIEEEKIIGDTEFLHLIELLKSANIGLAYKYEGTMSGNSFVIRLDSNEL